MKYTYDREYNLHSGKHITIIRHPVTNGPVCPGRSTKTEFSVGIVKLSFL